MKLSPPVRRRAATVLLGFLCCGLNAMAQDASSGPDAGPKTVLQTTVRRVVVDVVVTDRDGKPVSGLTRDDFTVREDGEPQRVLNFESSGFRPGMDFLPPKLPETPPNMFFNVPREPEKGPLYVLLYDLVNMDNEDQMALTVNQHQDQMFGRQQLMKFIESKPEGSRFAIYVWSDGLHLLQGFTADKQKLYGVIDPKHPGPHIPQVLLMGQNLDRGNTALAASIFRQLAADISGLPGRKNVIWFSGGFPLAFTFNDLDGPRYAEQIKATLDVLAQEQIAIYPVDVRGVVAVDQRNVNGIADDKRPVDQSGRANNDPAAASNNSPEAAGASSPARTSHAGGGMSLLRSSYLAADEVARETGGRAFYSSNDVAGELDKATEAGQSYYTLVYSPSDHDMNGKLRHIRVEVNHKDLNLAYRRAYYATPQSTGTAGEVSASGKRMKGAGLLTAAATTDTLTANMHHGGPMAHSLLFAVQVHAAGGAERATSEQTAAIAKGWMVSGQLPPGSAAHPLRVQRYQLSYRVFGRQFPQRQAPDLEMAAAAFDAEGNPLNSSVMNSVPAQEGAAAATSRMYRVDEDFVVPANAAFLRFAVRDAGSDRIGAVEVKLPLAPE